MTDCLMVVDGVIRQVWRGQTKEQLPPMEAGLFDRVVEVASNTVDINATWNGEKFVPPSPPKIILSYAEFRARFTDEERAALFEAMRTSWQLDDLVGLARAQNAVDVTGTLAAAAKAILVSTNVLTQMRADEIFA